MSREAVRGGPHPHGYRLALPLANPLPSRLETYHGNKSKGRRRTRHCSWTVSATLDATGGCVLSSGEGDTGSVWDDQPRAQRTFNPGNGDFHLGQFVPHSSNLSAKTARLLGHITHLRIQRVEFVLNTVIVRLIRLPVSRQLLAEIAADDLGLTVDIIA